MLAPWWLDPSRESGTGPLAVHILEDDPGVSDSLLMLFKNLGLEATAYPDAESFFETAKPVKDDTIIVDLLLPGISGATVIGWLKTLKEPPRIVAISGQAQSAIDRQLKDVGPVELIRKPLSIQTLSTLV